MSAATRARTARGRAGIAIRMIKAGFAQHGVWWQPRRAFDDCFEMFDGNEVAAIISRRADFDPELRHALTKLGFDSILNAAREIDGVLF